MSTEQVLKLPLTGLDALAFGIRLHVAESQDGTMYLSRSRGRRKAGRLTSYSVHYGPYSEEDKGFFRLTAATDEEALEKANRRLAKILEEERVQRADQGSPA